eukprot:CCRYP_018972-RA/>CCRYP_018972-RA protein AED:0.27 eAED:0.27 QI:0/-1/0/1/-1/1/1/0/96
MKILRLPLLAPGKILQRFGQRLLSRRIEPIDFIVQAPGCWAGLTATTPMSLLEKALEGTATAACADDTEIYESIWASPGEMKEAAQARQVLRQLAV